MVPGHVVGDSEQAIHAAVRAVFALPLLLNVWLEDDMGLETHTHTNTHIDTRTNTHYRKKGFVLLDYAKLTIKAC